MKTKGACLNGVPFLFLAVYELISVKGNNTKFACRFNGKQNSVRATLPLETLDRKACRTVERPCNGSVLKAARFESALQGTHPFSSIILRANSLEPNIGAFAQDLLARDGAKQGRTDNRPVSSRTASVSIS